ASITQVSGHRLFPLRYYDNETRVYDARVEKKLSNTDVINIRKAAFIALGGAGILDSIDVLNAELEEKKQQIDIKNNDIKNLTDQVADLTCTLDDLTTPDS
ncbi:hypothetical protein, partial [Erwinia amylovora]